MTRRISLSLVLNKGHITSPTPPKTRDFLPSPLQDKQTLTSSRNQKKNVLNLLPDLLVVPLSAVVNKPQMENEKYREGQYMGHPTLLVPDGLSFKVLVQVQATMRVKMLILHKSDFDYMLTFYPPPMERLRDELTDWAEVLRWISLPKVYAKKIRRIAQMNSGNSMDLGAGGGGAGERKGSSQNNKLASVVLSSRAGNVPALRRSSTKKMLSSPRGKGGGNVGGEADRRRGTLNRGRVSQEKQEKGRGNGSDSSKELRAEKSVAGGGAAGGVSRGGGVGGIGASPPEATSAPAVRESLLSTDQLPSPRSR